GRERRLRCRHDRRPHLAGILFGSAVIEQRRTNGATGPGDRATVGGDQGDLRSTGAEVDGEHARVGHDTNIDRRSRMRATPWFMTGFTTDADAPPSAPSRTVVELLGPSTGGIRVHVGELARRLQRRGWSVTVLGPAHVMDGAGDQAGVVDVPSAWNPISLMRARRQLARRCSGVTLVHVHGLKAALVALTLRRRPPMVLTVHNLVVGTRHGMSARLLHRLESFIIRHADHVIVISDEIGQRLRGTVPDDRQSFVLPVSPTRAVSMTRTEVRHLHGIADDAPMVVIVARHHLQKDLPMFLRAMAAVHRALPAARAVMVGDGPDRRSIEAERDRLGLTDVVVIAGHRPNPVDEMHAADVVALSSRWEGSPLVVAECLALGRPLVTTAVG
ncbi:MAG: group 1 glycosyl transferase, partial [Acidimicrobiaceae bacterium]